MARLQAYQPLLVEGVLQQHGGPGHIPHLNQFSGEVPQGKSEVSFDQWVLEHKSILKSYGETILQETMTQSLWGTMANSVWYLSLGASVTDILLKLMTMCGTVASFDILMQRFYGLQQTRVRGYPLSLSI